MTILNYLTISMICVLTAAFAWAEENGTSRGGGNAIICFTPPQIAETYTVRESKTGRVTQYLPIDWKKHWNNVNSVRTYDLYLAEARAGKQLGIPGTALPRERRAELDAELEKVLKFFDGTISKISSHLRRAAERLPIKDAVMDQLEPVYDIPRLTLIRHGCVLNTMLSQQGTFNNPSWAYDPNSFHHEKHSLLSQVSGYLHELSYLLSRTEAGVKNSLAPTLFVSRVFQPDTTYDEMLRAFSEVLLADPSKGWAPEIQLPQYLQIIKLTQRMRLITYKTVYSNEKDAISVVDPGSAHRSYQSEYRKDWMDLKEIPKEIIDAVDKDIMLDADRSPRISDYWEKEILKRTTWRTGETR